MTHETPATYGTAPQPDPTPSAVDAFQGRYEALLERMCALRLAKGSDYGDNLGDNLHASRGLGIAPSLGVLLRMNDKWERLKVLTRKAARGQKAAVADETIADTLLDLANYALLAIVLLEEEAA